MAPENDRDDDLEPDDVEDDGDFEEDGGDQTEVTIEVRGLSLYTHHGVSAAEREVGQRLRPHHPPRGGRSASGSSSTSAWRSATATRPSPTWWRTPSTTARSATPSRSSPSSAPTRRSSA